jgi:hypothetical protein
METKEDDYENYDFGWWPEIVGAVGVLMLVWYLIAFARGSL